MSAVFQLSKCDVNNEEYRYLKERVDEYAKKHSRGTVQGGAEWILSRVVNIDENGAAHVSIGGSELAQAIGCNKYRTRDELVALKVQMLTEGAPTADESPDTIVNTTWGHLLEPFSRDFICAKWGAYFIEIDASIPHTKVPNFRLSPDGIGVINIHNTYADSHKYYVVALELKNKFTQGVSKADVPTYYLPQVMAATDTLDVTNFTLYAECIFRVQGINDVGRPRYNARVHYRSSINGKKGSERFQGLHLHGAATLFFYSTDTSLRDFIMQIECDEEGHENMQFIHNYLLAMRDYRSYEYSALIDIGATDDMLFALSLKAVKQDLLKVHYGEFSLDPGSTRKGLIDRCEQFRAWCDEQNYVPIGLLNVGLFQYFYKLHPRDSRYVEDKAPILRAVHDDVLAAIQDKELHEYFRDVKWA